MQPKPSNVVAGNLYNREDNIRNLLCVSPPMGCGRQIDIQEFSSWDGLTQQEYRQSGWCLKCQDDVFRDPDEDQCTCDDGPCCEVDVGVGILTCGDKHQRICPIHEMQDPQDYDPDMREEDLPADWKTIYD